MKKEYIKPDMKVVEIEFDSLVLAGSNQLRRTSTNLDEDLEDEDDLGIDGNTTVGSGFWGR